MDHNEEFPESQEFVDKNNQFVQMFVIKHNGNAYRMGQKLYEFQMKYANKIEEQVLGEIKTDSTTCAIRALAQATFRLGMYSVDNPSTMPRSKVLKAMLGAWQAASKLIVKNRSRQFYEYASRAIGGGN
jgi:hypothetical protein